MSGGRDEVQAGVDARVMVAVQCALDFQLLLQIRLELGIDELHDGLVTVDQKRWVKCIERLVRLGTAGPNKLNPCVTFLRQLELDVSIN